MTNNVLRTRFTAITLFPDMFEAIKQEGVIARAVEEGLIEIETLQMRDFSNDARRNVDGAPIGGGDGCVIRPDVSERALEQVLTAESFVVQLSPAGKVFDNQMAKVFAKKSHIVFLCGRYAGFDHRVTERYVNLEVSIGDYVLSGGEIPCMCIIDTTSRFIPGVLGNELSAESDSHEDGLLEAPCYTKPLLFQDFSVPEVLLSGDHKKIERHRRFAKLEKTALNRPDLIMRAWETLNRSERAFVEKVWKHESKST